MSAFIGSAFIVIGGALNNIVISATNGKMPVFPTLSRLTGYTKLKFLSDIFDIGYSVMSIGDIFIRFFVFLIVFNTIKQLTINPKAKLT